MNQEVERSFEPGEDGAIDMSKVSPPVKVSVPVTTPGEREAREKTKNLAPAAPKGAYVCLGNVRSDGKKFIKGDLYEGKLYPTLLESNSICTKEAWDKR